MTKRIIFLMLGLLVIELSSLYAQSWAPCNGDCSDPWTPPQNYHVCFGTSTDYCCFVYTMMTRNTCGAQEVAITQLRVNIDAGNSCTFERMLYEALRDAILNNRTGLEPNENGECAMNWRVTTGACWRSYWMIVIETGLQSTYYEPCSDNVCCYQQYRVCRSEAGSISFQRMIPGTVTTPTCSTNCAYYSCEVVKNLDGPPPTNSKRVIEHGVSEDSFVGAIVPNPTTGVASLTLRNVPVGELHLLVVDSKGAVVIARVEEITDAEEHRVDVDFGSLPSGIYHYALTRAGELVAAGKIQVVQ